MINANLNEKDLQKRHAKKEEEAYQRKLLGIFHESDIVKINDKTEVEKEKKILSVNGKNFFITKPVSEQNISELYFG